MYYIECTIECTILNDYIKEAERHLNIKDNYCILPQDPTSADNYCVTPQDPTLADNYRISPQDLTYHLKIQH